MGKYSPDVMIPAFLATYAGGDASTTSLNLFPSMLSMLPNWRLTYSGLISPCFIYDIVKTDRRQD